MDIPLEHQFPFTTSNSVAVRHIPLSDEQGSGLDKLRSAYMRDRDRIIFSKSFRRLAHKTQVYLTGKGNEHLRTRLTHTLEVSQLSKSLGRALNLNEDLVEAIALGHDVGHAPFGHAGERQLNECLSAKESLPRRVASRLEAQDRLRNAGHFRHNYQSVRLLAFIEEYSPKYDGLNLTIQTLDGILKHTSVNCIGGQTCCRYPGEYAWPLNKIEPSKYPYPRSTEAVVVSLMDEVAQLTHDLSDAIALGIIHLPDFLRRKEIQNVLKHAQARKKEIPTQQELKNINNVDVYNALITSAIANYFVDHTGKVLTKKLEEYRIECEKDSTPILPLNRWILTTPEPVEDFRGLKDLKNDLVINNYGVNRMDNKGTYIIRMLFHAYICDPRQLPDSALHRYMVVKRKELSKRRRDGFKDWIRHQNDVHRIKESMTEDEETRLIDFVECSHDGSEIRTLSYSFLTKLIPYIAVDADYVRSIVDFIALMTDSYAESEVNKLYH